MTARAKPKPDAEIDKWVETREPVATVKPTAVTKPKRLTIDIDPSMHKKLKMSCVARDIQIADLLRTLIEHELGDQIQTISDR